MGIVAEVITVFSRKKLFAYKTVIYTAIGTGVLSFFVGRTTSSWPVSTFRMVTCSP